MNTTSLSLLERLKSASPSADDWRRLQEVYLPLVHHQLAAVSGLRDEADDLAQEVLIVLVRELPTFERQRRGSFRAWLRQITVNWVRTYCEGRRKVPGAGLGEDVERALTQLEDPDSDLARQWDREHDKHVVQKLLAVVRTDFDPKTWQAFTRFALDEAPAADVARELDMSEGAVVQAKSRVLKRLREEAGDLMT
jgi:RNA polymerase sigma-70 factor (ECF subfamily)